MGLLKTQKLDNGEIGFECIYGGLEAPFGGIDASKAPRYIDPKCFADASNFLLIDNELCSCSLEQAQFFPLPVGITYPLPSSSTAPGVLLGVGRLPCENVNKSWALYVSPSADSNNYWHYRLILWANDYNNVIESYDFPLLGQQITAPAKQSQAEFTVGYAFPFTAVQSMPPFPIVNDSGVSTTPTTYDGNYYEVCKWNPSITGTPTPGPGQSPYLTNFLWNDFYVFGSTPSSGPASIPTPASIVTDIINQFNASTSMPFKAFPVSGDPNSFTLKAYTQPGYPSVDGAAGNSLALTGVMVTQEFGYYVPTSGQQFINVPPGPPPYNYTLNNPDPFGKPSFVISASSFSGGTDSGQVIYSNSPISQLTWETIGDNLFLGGWPAGYMLQFNNSTKQFIYLTQYQGARVLKKMAGHLISVGMINSAQQTETNTHLWFNWSKEGVFSEWRALDDHGLVTGAGGSQLADISDQLTGLVVSNSVAFILRAEGLSYASVLQGAAVPFDINHVALCKDGQGCPSTSLWTQFDQLGFYVGTTNVFMLSQGPQAVGDKILETLFPSLISAANFMQRIVIGGIPGPWFFKDPPPMQDKFYNKVNVEPLTFPRSQRVTTQFAINIAGIIYMYDPQDGTWMKLNTDPIFPATSTWNILKCVSLYRNATTGYTGSYQSKEAYVYGQSLSSGSYAAPTLYQFSIQVPSTQSAHIWFPAEEISLGRDITIDAVYVLACGIPGAEVDITVDGWQGAYVTAAFSGKLIFGPNASPTTYEEYQVFNSDGSAVTLKAPQLHVDIHPQSISYLPPIPYPVISESTIKITKVAMFGKFDPAQRPV